MIVFVGEYCIRWVFFSKGVMIRKGLGIFFYKIHRSTMPGSNERSQFFQVFDLISAYLLL